MVCGVHCSRSENARGLGNAKEEEKNHAEKLVGEMQHPRRGVGRCAVNQGVVLLGGTAKTLSAHLRAVEVASGVPGVRRVASEIQSPDTLADAEIWSERTPEPATAGAGVFDTASDIWITSATKMRLLADSQIPALDINVDTWNGVVTLFGIVSSKEAKASRTSA